MKRAFSRRLTGSLSFDEVSKLRRRSETSVPDVRSSDTEARGG